MRTKLLCCLLLLLSVPGFCASTPIDLSAPIPANTVLAGPTSGGNAIAAPRAIVVSDIPAGVALTANLSTVATTGVYSDLSGKPTLSTVATTGAYADLTGKPTLGTAAAFNSGVTAGTIPVLNGSALIAPTLLGSGSGITTKFLQGDGTWQSIDLSNLNATNLTSGTIPNGRFPATLPAASGANLTALTAANIAIPARIGTATTADAAADVLIATSGTSKKGLVIQCKPSQSGSVFEVQFNNGFAEFSIDESGGVHSSAGFYGSAASLTGIPAAQLTGALPAIDGSALTGVGVNTGTATFNGMSGTATVTVAASVMTVSYSGTGFNSSVAGTALWTTNNGDGTWTIQTTNGGDTNTVFWIAK